MYVHTYTYTSTPTPTPTGPTFTHTHKHSLFLFLLSALTPLLSVWIHRRISIFLIGAQHEKRVMLKLCHKRYTEAVYRSAAFSGGYVQKISIFPYHLLE